METEFHARPGQASAASRAAASASADAPWTTGSCPGSRKLPQFRWPVRASAGRDIALAFRRNILQALNWRAGAAHNYLPAGGSGDWHFQSGGTGCLTDTRVAPGQPESSLARGIGLQKSCQLALWMRCAAQPSGAAPMTGRRRQARFDRTAPATGRPAPACSAARTAAGALQGCPRRVAVTRPYDHAGAGSPGSGVTRENSTLSGAGQAITAFDLIQALAGWVPLELGRRQELGAWAGMAPGTEIADGGIEATADQCLRSSRYASALNNWQAGEGHQD